MNSKKILAGVLALATLAGCGGTSSDTTTDKTEAEKTSGDSLSGTVTASGSSALLPLKNKTENVVVSKKVSQ